MRRMFFVTLLILLVILVLIAGCSTTASPTSKAPASATTSAAPPPTSASAAPASSSVAPGSSAAAKDAAKPIELKFTSGSPFTTGLGAVTLVPWKEKIEAGTAAIGKPVKITLYGTETLVKFVDTYDGVIKGIADIGAPWGPQHFPGRMPLMEVFQLPMLFPTATAASQAAQELYDTRKEFQNELKDAKLLFFCSTPPTVISSRTKQIKTLEDMKGMKMTARPGYTSLMVEKLGGVPVSMAPPEAYQAAERGVVDTIIFNWDGHMVFKYYEVTKYRTETPVSLYSDPLACSINLNTWNKLPPEVQAVFNENSGMKWATEGGKAFDASGMAIRNKIRELDQKAGNPDVYMIPNDEFQRWVKAITPLYDKWIADTEAKGLPGKSIFEDVKRLAAKYSAAK
jgi:TRAP-type C4-dicarboxylate transport system substrate-binding protein